MGTDLRDWWECASVSGRPVYASDLFRLAERIERQINALAARCPDLRDEVRICTLESMIRRIAPEALPAFRSATRTAREAREGRKFAGPKPAA
jgi:hypothetical protein